MTKYLLISMLFCLANIEILAQVYPHQEAEDNIFKYWTYQRKLENYFITEPGDFYVDGSGIPASIVDMCGNYIRWGDAPIDLSWYISKLAIEYNLLKRTGEDTSIVVEKLFQELSTLNRLDAFAELKENPNYGSNINLEGYFLRDDVYNTTGISTPAKTYLETEMASDYKELRNGQHVDQVQESQDQIIHLLLAMKCVRDWVPNAVTYKRAFDMDTYNGITSSIHDEAVNITNRLCYYSRDRAHWITHRIPHQWYWEIDDNALSSLSAHTPVHTGSNSLELSVGFNDSQEKIIDNSTASLPPINFFNFPLIIFSWEDIGSYFKWFYANNVWNFLKFVPLGQQEDIKVQILAAIADNWHPSSFFFPQTTEALLLKYRASLYNNEIFPLFYSVSHGAPCFYSSSFYWNMLNSATVSGAYRYANNIYFPSSEWSSTQRFTHPERRFPGNWQWFKGDYNNLDYMLLFNLFYIKNWYDLPPYLNGFNAHISNLVNFPYHGYGSLSEPYKVNAFETIHAVNEIGVQGDVTYKAGISIDLQDGFITDPGAQFLAYISPFPEEDIHARCQSFDLRKANTQNIENKREDESKIKIGTNLNISPNPANENITIDLFAEEISNAKIVLYDIYNRCLKNIQNKVILIGENKIDMNISDLKSGTYFLKIEIGNDKSISKKIIKL